MIKCTIISLINLTLNQLNNFLIGVINTWSPTKHFQASPQHLDQAPIRLLPHLTHLSLPDHTLQLAQQRIIKIHKSPKFFLAIIFLRAVHEP